MTLYYFNNSGRMHQDGVLLVHASENVEFLCGYAYGRYTDYLKNLWEHYEQLPNWTVIHTNR